MMQTLCRIRVSFVSLLKLESDSLEVLQHGKNALEPSQPQPSVCYKKFREKTFESRPLCYCYCWMSGFLGFLQLAVAVVAHKRSTFFFSLSSVDVVFSGVVCCRFWVRQAIFIVQQLLVALNINQHTIDSGSIRRSHACMVWAYFFADFAAEMACFPFFLSHIRLKDAEKSTTVTTREHENERKTKKNSQGLVRPLDDHDERGEEVSHFFHRLVRRQTRRREDWCSLMNKKAHKKIVVRSVKIWMQIIFKFFTSERLWAVFCSSSWFHFSFLAGRSAKRDDVMFAVAALIILYAIYCVCFCFNVSCSLRMRQKSSLSEWTRFSRSKPILFY